MLSSHFADADPRRGGVEMEPHMFVTIVTTLLLLFVL